MPSIIDNMIALARAEWGFFGKQEIDINGQLIKTGKRETHEGFWQRVGVYWKQGVNLSLTGLNTDQAWSAAFISFIMRKAGAGTRFLYSQAHRDYINKAIKAKLAGTASAAFWGHRLNEYKPKVGDLVGYSRQSGVSYDSRPAGYKSHTDIVVAVQPGEILVIGGNVRDSVSMKHLKINSQGLLIDKQHDWFVVMENRLV